MEESADVVFHPRGGDIPDFTSLVTIQANTAYDLTIYTEPDQQLFLGAVRLQTGQQGDTEFDGVDLAEEPAPCLTSDGLKAKQPCELKQIFAEKSPEIGNRYTVKLNIISPSTLNPNKQYRIVAFWASSESVLVEQLTKSSPKNREGAVISFSPLNDINDILPNNTRTSATQMPTATPTESSGRDIMPTTQPFDTTATGTGLTIPTITPERGGNDSGADDKADNEDGKIPATTSSNHSGGLTAGAKAGVGVGAAAAVIIILALILIWLRKRKRSRARAGGYLEPTRSERELKEKEGVGIVAHSTHGSTSQIAGSEAAGMGAGAGVARSGSYHLGDDRSGLGGGAAAPAVGKKPIAGAAGAEDLENGRESRASVPTQTLSEEERARWEEEERRLDADIAEAERRRRV